MANQQCKTLIIVGAGGHGRVVADCAEALNIYQTIVFIDDCFAASPARKNNAHWPIIDTIEHYSHYLEDADFIVAFGDSRLRLELTQKLLAANANVISLIHPKAHVSRYAEIGVGTMVAAGAVINIGTRLGIACIVNTLASIDHDCQIADGVHIAPNACLAGGVNIGRLTFIGVASSICQYLSVTANCIIGAGAAVVDDIKTSGTYVGIPAKRNKSH